MKFLYYWPLALLILIPVIIVFYLLKQRAVEHPYSSIFLWKELYQNRQSDTPWEKLKKNLLMVLQILTLIVLILAICSPYLLRGGRTATNAIIVIDSSGSMNMTYDKNHTRLEAAKEQAVSYIQNLGSNTSITVIDAADDEATLLLSNAKDKQSAIAKVRSIEAGCFVGDMTAAVDMVRTLQLQLTEGSEAVFFTDSYIALENISGYEVNLYTPADNAYVEYVSYGEKDDGLTVLAKIANEYSEDLTTDVNLYGDGSLLAVKSVTIPKGGSEIVYFEQLAFDGADIQVEINQPDALMEDNSGYEVIEKEGTQADVLLFTQQNLYLEKAITVNSSINLTKSEDVANLAQFETEGYDLYIFDGLIPDHIPENGNVVLINVLYDDLYESTLLSQGLVVNAEEQTITKYLEDMSFGVSKGYALTVPNFAESFLTTSEGSVGFYGQKDGQTYVVLGFDVHDTQLPLTMQFPILVQNILSETITTGMCASTKVDCGQSMKISSDLSGGDVTVTKPDGEASLLPVGAASFTDTDQVGYYGVDQQVGGETKTETFAVNFPSAESSTAYVAPAEDSSGTTTVVADSIQSTLNLRNFIILLALLLLCVEWIVYVKQS